MRKLFLLLAMLAGTVVLAPAALAVSEGKVALCHQTSFGSNLWVEIEVNENAVEAHVENHGDFIVDGENPCPSEGGTLVGSIDLCVEGSVVKLVVEPLSVDVQGTVDGDISIDASNLTVDVSANGNVNPGSITAVVNTGNLHLHPGPFGTSIVHLHGPLFVNVDIPPTGLSLNVDAEISGDIEAALEAELDLDVTVTGGVSLVLTDEECELPAGPPGDDGADGNDGLNGADGTPGASVAGPAGPQGPAGPAGADGNTHNCLTPDGFRFSAVDCDGADYAAEIARLEARIAALEAKTAAPVTISDTLTAEVAGEQAEQPTELAETGASTALPLLGLGLLLFGAAPFALAKLLKGRR